MKRSHKTIYVTPMVNRAVELTEGKANPVCVDAYRLFDKSCEEASLPHTHGPDDSVHLINIFGQEFIKGCDSHDITVVKVPLALIAAVGHGRQAEYTEENTPSILANASIAKRSQPAVGYALCGRDCDKGHTILTANREKRITPIVSGAINMIGETDKMVGRDQLAIEDLEYVADELGRVHGIARAAAIKSRGDGDMELIEN